MTSPENRPPTPQLRALLRVLGDGQLSAPRGLSAELLGWELGLPPERVVRMLVRAYRRGYIERCGVDDTGRLLWRLTARGREFIAAPAGHAAGRRRLRRPPAPPRRPR